VGKDLDSADLNIKYIDLMEQNITEKIQKKLSPKLVHYLSKSNEFKNITILFACCIAANPHSADIEQ
jgi:hypothetical protein